MVIKVLQTLAEYGHFNLQIAIIITKKMLVFEIKHSDLVVSKQNNSLELRNTFKLIDQYSLSHNFMAHS